MRSKNHKTKLSRKVVSFTLAAAMAVSSIIPSYATDTDPVIDEQAVVEATVVDEQDSADLVTMEPETEEVSVLETDAALEAIESVTEDLLAEAEDEEESIPYIILLPIENGTAYKVDVEHMAAEFSTDEYTVLLYDEGEEVALGVDSDKQAVIMNALEQTVFLAADKIADGHVEFAMPASDLELLLVDEHDAKLSEPVVNEPAGTDVIQSEANVLAEMNRNL